MAKASTTAKASDKVPFIAFGNVAVGVIAIGNAAFGVVAIGASLSCGVVAIGMNTVGVVSLGLNSAGPVALALINSIGVISAALVNTLGGIGAGPLNAGHTPLLGIAFAVGFFLLGTKLAATKLPEPEQDANIVPLGRLRHVEPGPYTVRATIDRSGKQFDLVDGDQRVPIELGDGNGPARGDDLVAMTEYFEKLEGVYYECVVNVVDEIAATEGDYRTAPDKHRRYIMRGGRVMPRHEWTRARLTRACGRWTQLGSIATGGLCGVMMIG